MGNRVGNCMSTCTCQSATLLDCQSACLCVCPSICLCVRVRVRVCVCVCVKFEDSKVFVSLSLAKHAVHSTVSQIQQLRVEAERIEQNVESNLRSAAF